MYVNTCRRSAESLMADLHAESQQVCNVLHCLDQTGWLGKDRRQQMQPHHCLRNKVHPLLQQGSCWSSCRPEGAPNN